MTKPESITTPTTPEYDMYIYHVFDRKVGSTKNIKRRMSSQCIREGEFEILQTITAGALTYREIWEIEQEYSGLMGYKPENEGHWQTFYRTHTNPPANDPEAMAKLSAATKASMTPERRAKHSAATKASMTPERLARMSASMTGEKHPMWGKARSAETRSKISVAMSGENNPLWGKTPSSDTRAKISASKTGINNYNAKLANIYCYYTNKLIAENVVMSIWAKENGYHKSNLSGTATGRLKQTKGVYARYVKDT